MRQGLTPANAVTLASVSSPTLAEVVRDINKYSNNTMARQLFLTLGAEFAQEGDVLRDGEAAARRWATQRKLALPGLQLENSSGLSRRERISAAGLGALLQAGANSPYAPEFMASLPIAARDGTLRRRFVGQPVEARFKTGSLNDVRALAGYVKAVDGRRYALVVLISSPRQRADPGHGCAGGRADPPPRPAGGRAMSRLVALLTLSLALAAPARQNTPAPSAPPSG